MEASTKRTFGWACIVIGCLLIGVPLASYVGTGINTLSVIIGVLGLVIAVNGARYINRADEGEQRKKKLRRKKKR